MINLDAFSRSCIALVASRLTGSLFTFIVPKLNRIN